jgi:hypothetical protein
MDAIVAELPAHESLDEREIYAGQHRAPCGDDAVARSGASVVVEGVSWRFRGSC